MHSKESYRQFCKTTDDLPVFFQDWYLDAVCEDGNWDVLLVEEGKQTVAAMPLFVKRKGTFRYITMPLFVKHMGPFLVPEKRKLKFEHHFYNALISQLPKSAYFIQDLHPSVKNWLPFHWQNYRQTTRYTYVLDDLNDLEKVFEKFNRNIRRNIRKAQKNLQITSDFSLDIFYKINNMSIFRQGLSPFFSFAQLKKHDEALEKHHARKLFFAIDQNDRIHAASYLIWDKKRSYYHLAGEDPDFRGSGASILLTWEAIKFTKKELGLQVFDFEGSMLKSIEMIRQQFGARQEPYFRVWKYNSKLFQILNRIIKQ